MFSAGPGTDEWRVVIAEERAFFNVVMARCRAMRLPVKAVENAGFLSFKTMEELKPIGEQLEEVLERMRDEMFRNAFGVRLSEN